jgi:hypothetical protein
MADVAFRNNGKRFAAPRAAATAAAAVRAAAVPLLKSLSADKGLPQRGCSPAVPGAAVSVLRTPAKRLQPSRPAAPLSRRLTHRFIETVAARLGAEQSCQRHCRGAALAAARVCATRCVPSDVALRRCCSAATASRRHWPPRAARSAWWPHQPGTLLSDDKGSAALFCLTIYYGARGAASAEALRAALRELALGGVARGFAGSSAVDAARRLCAATGSEQRAGHHSGAAG